MKTIAEISDEIGVSKQAIHQKIKQDPLSTTLRQFTSMNGNALLVDDKGEELIKSVFPKERASTNTRKSVDEVKDKLIDTLQSQIDILTEQNSDLRNQLNIEREHSREQANEIIDLAKQLAKLNENQQILLLSEQTKNAPLLSETISDERKQSTETSDTKKESVNSEGFFKKLLKKRR